ncbi:hypothetical protein PA598K_01852 [Paenibacillus sp. 598K]|uniref:S-layer homology domain-containing protein n=1 Tax=Paenibacillus sp. 598K TaxID=1117987 RepID=UPI000FF96D77|nr:S-layer homology domain-containing protein [Paenibacillus sp. 598K]GBF73553.1 hypothetical protein PA598K_01852 [Paenibacillus sp. 598K]
MIAKKLIGLLAAGTMLWSGVSGAFAATGAVTPTPIAVEAAPQTDTVNYRDTAGHWGAGAIERWSGYGVVRGHEGAFRPNAPVTRAEFATMIDNIMRYQEAGSNPFADLSSEQWYYDAILKLHAAGVLQGADGKAAPLKPITRQEAAVLVAGAFETSSQDTPLVYSDADRIASWARAAVQSLTGLAVIKGMPDGAFQPDGQLTRAEAVTLLDNLIPTLITEPGVYSQDATGYLVINSPDVTLQDMKITGSLFIAQGVGEGDIKLDSVEIDGDVHVQGGGEHSIIFNHVGVKGALVVNKYNGKVRVLATGSTSVSVTILDSGALLVTRELTGGGFETVEISAELTAGQEIQLDGSFGTVVNRSETVGIKATGTIKELVAEAKTSITGSATVQKVSGEQADATKVNGESVAAPKPGTGEATTPTPGAPTTPGTGGGGSGGGTGGNPGGGTTTVAATGVSITESARTLTVGDRLQLQATVTPANATNKNVRWSLVEPSEAVTVSSQGLVVAVSPGVAKVQATTVDGGHTALAEITVEEGRLALSVVRYAGDIVDPGYEIAEAILANSETVSVPDVTPSLTTRGHGEVAVTAQAPLLETANGRELYVAIALNGPGGVPLADPAAVAVTVDGAAVEADFGTGLAEAHQSGAWLLKLDAGDPETIRQYRIEAAAPGYTQGSLLLTYRPQGTVVLQAIDAIAGEAKVGAMLDAGELAWAGEPREAMIRYQWYRSTQAEGLYTAIQGADDQQYRLTEQDGGQYIRLCVSTDEQEHSGSAWSTAFGPVSAGLSADEVFEAIEAEYLADNTSRTSIVGNLSLPGTLADYPGVTIAWASSDEQTITTAGVVSRDATNDRFVTLTATLGGLVTGERSFELIVRAQGMDNVEIEGFIDPYFVADYPQAFVKDGNIHVRYALQQPAELYMVVNVINGAHKSDVKAVLEGHAGIGYVVYADSWPYFKVDASMVGEVQEFDTGVSVMRGSFRDSRVEFVVVDKSAEYTSAQVTTILFDSEVIGALDTFPPTVTAVYLNEARDALYLYFNEMLDTASLPSAVDFTLTSGEVDEVVSITNNQHQSFVLSSIKLKVSGIAEADKSGLRLSYSGDAIRDLSDADNRTEPFTGKEVYSSAAEITRATISSDRLSMIVELVPGWHSEDNQQLPYDAGERFAIQIDGGQAIHPVQARYYYSSNWLSYRLKFASPLPEGDVALSLDTSGIISWAKDLYPAELTTDEVQQIAAPGTPSAEYRSGSSDILVSLAEGYELQNIGFIAAGFVLRVDGEEYPLRGYHLARNYEWVDGNLYYSGLSIRLDGVYEQRFRALIEAGAQIELKYVKVNGDADSQVSDAAGALLPDFDYIPVSKQP